VQMNQHTSTHLLYVWINTHQHTCGKSHMKRHSFAYTTYRKSLWRTREDSFKIAYMWGLFLYRKSPHMTLFSYIVYACGKSHLTWHSFMSVYSVRVMPHVRMSHDTRIWMSNVTHNNEDHFTAHTQINTQHDTTHVQQVAVEIAL